MQSDDLGAKKKTKITLDFRFLFCYIKTVIIIIIILEGDAYESFKV